MAKFDASTIEGFEGMTAEQKVEALLQADIPDKIDTSKLISKELFDKKASELAAAKKQLESKLSEDEKKKVEEDEAKAAEAQKFAELESKYNELMKTSTLKEHTISLTGLGFEEKLAAETANAIVDGDAGKLFANMKKFLDAYKKSIEKDIMDRTPGVGGSSGSADESDKAVEFAKSLYGEKGKSEQSYADILKRYVK